MSSFSASVWIHDFDTIKKQTLLHGTVKSTISDVSTLFCMHPQIDLTLESSGHKPLILHRELRGYKYLYSPTKHQKYIPAKLVLCIYKHTNTHINTAIGQLIAGAFFFNIQSCE